MDQEAMLIKKWDSLYEQGMQGKYPNEMVIRFINSKFQLNNNEELKVLDLGFGSGRHLAYLASEGFKTYGIEYSPRGFAMAQEWLKSKNLKASLQLGSILNRALYETDLDAIIDIACVQHNQIEDIKLILSNVYNSLRVGGYFFSVIKSPNDSIYDLGEFYGGITRSYPDGLDKIKNSTLISFPDIQDLHELFREFKELSIEKEEWTYGQMTKRVSHWVITAQK
jgi:SAM-dependent methyltransferase